MARIRKRPRTELKNTSYEIFIGVLSLLSVANLVLFYVFTGDPSLQTVLSVMNTIFSIVFLIDFLYRLRTAPSRTGYFFRQYGWADLLASLPFPQFKILRLIRLVRVVRLLSAVGVRTVLRSLIRDRANSALLTLLLLGVLVLEFGSITILSIEKTADGANITSASDALWYTIVTISTVGYGDRFPVTDAGRLIGAMIIVVGVGIFGTFTGYLANLFLAPHPADAETDAATAREELAAAEAGAVDAAAAGRARREARLQELLTLSEDTMGEIRELLAEGSDPDAEGSDPDAPPAGA